jgi:hypothetical protein
MLSPGMKRSVLSQHLSKLGRKGGKARLTTMTPERRREVASNAAKKRWAKAKRTKES